MIGVVYVLIEHARSALDKPFLYYFTSDMNPCIGGRVEVNFAHQKLVGFVVGLEMIDLDYVAFQNSNSFKVSKIERVIDEKAILTPELIELGKTLAKDTLTPLIACYQCFLPAALKPNSSKKTSIKQVYVYFSIDTDLKLPIKQLCCHDYIKANPGLKASQIPFTQNVLKALETKNCLYKELKEEYRLVIESKFENVSYELTAGQLDAIQLINNNPGPFLLYGVTGSGKSEVYLQTILSILKQNKTALVIFPEISLSSQTIKFYQSRLNCNLAIFHSGLSNGEKYDQYRQIAQGEINVVLGTRSAIFAPLKDIGVIIIDEEHSQSYKQESGFRYQVRDVALIRGKYHNAKVILGSATPSLDTYARALKNVYQLIKLDKRVLDLPLPKVEVIDLNYQAQLGNYGLLSLPLKTKMHETLDNHKQIMLLLNRKGYSPYVYCANCKHDFVCPNCKVSLSYHKDNEELVCHHCGYLEDYPKTCPICSSKFIRYFGSGSQKLEEAVYSEFKDVNITRMDSDSTKYKDGHQEVLAEFESGKSSILLGTQMITKGLNLPNVSLVGIVNADIGLNINHFRANEWTFSQLVQVIGRAGRYEDGAMAMLQTYKKNHFAIACAIKQDYDLFFKLEMEKRKANQYPPYFNMVLIGVKGDNKQKVYDIAEDIKNLLSDLPSCVVLGPAAPYIAKFEDNFIYKVTLKYKKKDDIYYKLKEIYDKYATSKYHIYFDFDPYSDS
jgi:primosomal protein N' (replication factor Y)